MSAIHTSKRFSILVVVLVVFYLLSLALLSYGNYAAGSTSIEMIVSSLLLSVPLVMLYFSIGLLVVAGQQKRSQGQISERLAKYVYRTPRIASLLITLFVGMFALDMFSEGLSFWEMVGGFLMHALPAIIMGIVVALAWRWPQIGFVAFTIAAIFFLRSLIFNPLSNFGTALLFSGPMAVIAMLFWADWKWKKELHLTPNPQ